MIKLKDPVFVIELRIAIDEAGRWPLAWPVWVGGVMQTHVVSNQVKAQFQDSKILKAQAREDLYEILKEFERKQVFWYASGKASAGEIDELGIIWSLQLGCLRMITNLMIKYYNKILRQKLLESVRGNDKIFVTVIDEIIRSNEWNRELDYEQYINTSSKEALVSFLKTFFSLSQHIFVFKGLLIDGNHNFGLNTLLDCNVKTIIKGDSKNPLISAASIVAKVERDVYMTSVSPLYPERNFEIHKGYGTLKHREKISQATKKKWKQSLTPEHRLSFLKNFWVKQKTKKKKINLKGKKIPSTLPENQIILSSHQKPKLLLHICCAPDLTRPLHWLKNYFKLYLFWYNPNIHPKPEHDKRYAEFVKLYNLEKGDYEIVEDWYEPKEFFEAFVKHKDIIHPDLKDADRNTVLKTSGIMREWSDRCNPCYLMRLEQAAVQAQKQNIFYFTSTLLISPKKLADKLFQYGLESQEIVTWTKFLWFDFAKKEGYKRAWELTKQYDLYRQNYCGCGWTIPKPGERKEGYRGW